MALLLIAMAGSVLAIMAKRSIFDASDVQQAQQQLEHRWAAYSLEKSLLPRAEKVIETLLEKDPLRDEHVFKGKVEFEIQLAETTYQLTLADENAKANVNQMIDATQTQTVSSQPIQRLLQDMQVRDIPAIQIQPYVWENATNSQAIQTLGQVFENVNPSQLVAFESIDPVVLDVLTCWGDGKLNLHSASPHAIKAVCLKQMTRGEIDKLIRARDANPRITLDAALTSAGVDKKKLGKIKVLFTEKTTCVSLWTRWETDRRTRYRLAVATQQASPKSTNQSTKQSPSQPQHVKLDSLIFEW
ncbi:MAG: hypothetical protein CMJ19_15280 [Phycisphaeraceae bacterium]|nr:hypothetical protein [Phycisphaeraceae bacterium]